MRLRLEGDFFLLPIAFSPSPSSSNRSSCLFLLRFPFTGGNGRKEGRKELSIRRRRRCFHVRHHLFPLFPSSLSPLEVADEGERRRRRRLRWKRGRKAHSYIISHFNAFLLSSSSFAFSLPAVARIDRWEREILLRKRYIQYFCCSRGRQLQKRAEFLP